MMKKILGVAGGVLGVLFAIWDTLINSAETAAPDQEWSISIVSWPFFIGKVLVYLLIGTVLGTLIGFILDKVSKKR